MKVLTMTTFLFFTHDGIKHLNLISLFMGIHIHITPLNFSFFSERGFFREKIFLSANFMRLEVFWLGEKI
jgi:hypothetical protein